jgi:hypothetical protein
MRYANVISKAYQIPAEKLDLAITDFLEQIAFLEPKINSLPFFSIQELSNGWLAVRLYMSIQSNMDNLPEGLHFDSYFYIDQMASSTFCGDSLEAQSAESYDKLLMFLENQDLIPTTPVFSILSGEDNFFYTILKVGFMHRPAI